MKRRSGLNFSRRRKKFNVPLFKEIMTWVLECAIVIAIAYALVSSFGFRTTVVGNAMQDTLQSEEQIFVNRFVYMVRAPKQGDVVVFLPNGNEKSHYYVKRVIGVPGGSLPVRGIRYRSKMGKYILMENFTRKILFLLPSKIPVWQQMK